MIRAPSTEHDILLKHRVGMFSSYGVPRCLIYGDPLHCLGLFISNAHRAVDLANFECRYNCCPYLYIFGAAWIDNLCLAIISTLPSGIRYILARVVTLVLAFTSLMDLPPGAYETIHWTTFILLRRWYHITTYNIENYK